VGGLDVAYAEDVTPALLGASGWQTEAFRSAAFAVILRFWITERGASPPSGTGAPGAGWWPSSRTNR